MIQSFREPTAWSSLSSWSGREHHRCSVRACCLWWSLKRPWGIGDLLKGKFLVCRQKFPLQKGLKVSLKGKDIFRFKEVEMGWCVWTARVHLQQFQGRCVQGTWVPKKGWWILEGKAVASRQNTGVYSEENRNLLNDFMKSKDMVMLTQSKLIPWYNV